VIVTHDHRLVGAEKKIGDGKRCSIK